MWITGPSGLCYSSDMKGLRIAREITLPIDAVTQTLAAIGRKGAGKTYLATLIAEQMLELQAQVIVIDPVGNWWGLRVDANGRSKGKEIFVIGGEHGDVPLIPTAGAKIARLVVEKNISAVIDVSGFRIGEHKRFAADFAEEFFHLKKSHKTPVHVFIEEAQKIIPQRVGPEEARMVGAFEQIVRLGRNYGIGCTLITQRPQSVNKEVLSQVECLCVLQITGPHERKALEDWVYEAGADRKLIGELPGLAQGEGYVWSPAWLRTYARVHFASKTTFDASATPEVGKATKAASTSAVDVEKLRADMADVIAEAEQDDPKALRRRIAEFEKGVGSKSPNAETISLHAVNDALRKADAYYAKEYAAHDKEWGSKLAEANKEIVRLGKIIAQVAHLVATGDVTGHPVPSYVHGIFASVGSSPTPDSVPIQLSRHDSGFAKRMEAQQSATTELTNPEQRIIDAIAWMEAIGVNEPSRPPIAFLAGYSNIRSTGFTNPCGSLKSKGLITYPPGKRIALTDEGRTLANMPKVMPTREALQQSVLAKLPGPESKLLEPLIHAYPDVIRNEDLAELAGYSNARSTGYTNPRGRLRSFELVEYTDGGVRAAAILFP